MAEQGMLEDPADPDAAPAAVLCAPCVELLDASPGNCTAACGLTDGDALMPAAAPADADPVVAEPAAGAGVNEVAPFDDPDVTPDEPAPQPSAIERLPMNELPDVEQGVPGRLAPLTVVVPNVPVAEEPVLDDLPAADVLVPDVVPFGAAPGDAGLCETI